MNGSAYAPSDTWNDLDVQSARIELKHAARVVSRETVVALAILMYDKENPVPELQMLARCHEVYICTSREDRRAMTAAAVKGRTKCPKRT